MLFSDLFVKTFHLTVQQVSDLVQVDFKVGNLPRRREQVNQQL